MSHSLEQPGLDPVEHQEEEKPQTAEVERTIEEQELLLQISDIDCDRESLVASWQQSAGVGVEIKKNLSRTEELELAAPGSVKVLQQEFHLEHFGRYPLQVLLDMYEQRGEAGNWGLLVYAKEDHNGALYENGPLKEMHSSIASSCKMRIIECDSVGGLSKDLQGMASSFEKASFLLISAHGAPDSIQLGEGKTITKENIEEDLGETFAQGLTEEAEICISVPSTSIRGACSRARLAKSAGLIRSSPPAASMAAQTRR